MSSATARVEVRDPRDGNGHLRLSWHPSRRIVVVSQWREDVCVASTPVPIGDVPGLMSLLTAALAEAVTDPKPAGSGWVPTARSVGEDLTTVLSVGVRRRMRGAAALAEALGLSRRRR